MDISNKNEKAGKELIDTVISATGLPEDAAESELNEILATAGQNGETLTLEQLRAAMIAYLESIQAELDAKA